MVLCLVLNGKKNVRNRFIVDTNETVWNEKKISHLQELIKEKKGNAFNKFDASDLELWKVSIQTKEVDGKFDEKLKILMSRPHMEINIKEELNGLLLDVEDNIKDHIEKDPTNNHIQIIVKPPVTTCKCFPIFYLSNKKFVEYLLSFIASFFFPVYTVSHLLSL
jgi:hypothetical protein